MLSKLLNIGVYIALLVLFGPILIIWAIEPDWVARVIGLSAYTFIIPFVPLYVSLTRRGDYFGLDSPLYKKFNKRYVDNTARGLLFLFGIVAFNLLVVPFSKDTLLISNLSAPIERTSYVAHTRSLSGNISEEVILDTYPEVSKDDDLTAWYFTPRHIMTGNTYTFLILPNSRLIIEAVPVEIINREIWTVKNISTIY
jgi:hypothetical protein